MSNSCIPRNELVLSERVRRLEQSLPQIDDTPFVIGVAANAGPAGALRTQTADALEEIDADWYLWPGDMISPSGTTPVTEASVIAGFSSFQSFAANKSSRALQAEDIAGEGSPGTATHAVYPDQLPSNYYKRSLAGGKVALFVLFTEEAIDPGTTQGDWLIEQIDQASEPWKIIMMGNPPRTTVAGGGDANSTNLGWLPYQAVHLIVTGDSILTEHLNTWGLNVLNVSYTARTVNPRGPSIVGEVHNDTQIVWPTYAEVPDGDDNFVPAVGKITVERDRMKVEVIGSADNEVIHTFWVARDAVAIAAPNNCCENSGGGGGNLTWEDEEAREAVAPDFVGQLGVQQDDGTIWIATGIGEGDWTLYECTQVFADAAARGSAVPTKIGQLGVQLDTNTVYRATGTSAGNWTPTFAQDTQTFANAAARTAATPNRIGQLGYQTDTNTLWKGTAVVAGSWSLVQETMTWSNDAARAALVPRFTGQLGIQLDTGLLYRSTGTSAGNWTSVEISQPDTIFLESNGNDSTGLTGYQSRPFLTATGALAAAMVVATANRNPTIKVGLGTFAAGDYSDTGTGVLTIQGKGEESSIITLNLGGLTTIKSDGSATLVMVPNTETVVMTNCVVKRPGSFGTTSYQYTSLTATDCKFLNKTDAITAVLTRCFVEDIGFSGDASSVVSSVTALNSTFNLITGGTNEGWTVDLTNCSVNTPSGRMNLTARHSFLGDASGLTGVQALGIYNCTAEEFGTVWSTTINTGLNIHGLTVSGDVDMTLGFAGGGDYRVVNVEAASITVVHDVDMGTTPVYMNVVAPDASYTAYDDTWRMLYNQHQSTADYQTASGTAIFKRTGGLDPTTGATGGGGVTLTDVDVNVNPA